jgi:site-specific recombinase XerD
MPNPRTADALTSIGVFLQAQQDAGYAAETVRLRGRLLTEYLEHALDEEKTAALTAEELVRPERADSWLHTADAGGTRRRNTLTGPDATAAHDSQRARIQTYNTFVDHLGLSGLQRSYPPAGHGDRLEPEQTHKLLRTLAVRRPTGANAATAIRTAAVAALVAATGHTVPQLHKLNVTDVDLERSPVPAVTVNDFEHLLDKDTVAILRRWLDVRAGITKALEGSDPGYLWIPTKPGRERVGVQPPKPGLTRAAVRTLHAAHRSLVLQVVGVPLRPYALLPRT